MTLARYNTRSGIAGYLTSLADLEQLKAERLAARQRGEILHEFCVLGRWYLDSVGNFGLMIDEERWGSRAPATLGKPPVVMTAEELALFMRGEGMGWSAGWAFPPAYATCDECGDYWNIDDCHEFVHRQGTDEAPLEPWVGMPLASAIEILELVNKTWHHVERDMVYSDTHQGETRSGANGKKWYRVGNDHVIQPGDRAMLQVMRFTHRGCHLRRTLRTSRQDMVAIFCKAGYPQAQLLSIPNQYCPCDSCPPWYQAQVDDLTPITIGWRKRVISINWSQTGKDLLELFPDEDVTKEAHLIHAWSGEKAAAYLAKILPALGATPSKDL